jgi:hypothetical protein
MRLSHLLPLVGAFGLFTPAAWAVDYSKIDRTIKKEPAYQSKAPQYALLLFGPEAKLRVWVVLDGDTVYIDRNGDGDLTGKDKRFAKLDECRDVEIADPDGKTRYVITAIGVFNDGDPPRRSLDVNVDVKGRAAYQQYCGVQMQDGPRKAHVAHFHGPLAAGPRTINWKLPPQLALHTGDKEEDLFAVVGTMDAEHGCWVVVRSHAGQQSAFPGVSPVVDIEFPSKKPGAPPVKQRYALDKFC